MLMGVNSGDDFHVARSRASWGLSPLTSEEMKALRQQGRDPEFAAIDGQDDKRFSVLEGAADNDERWRIRAAWIEAGLPANPPGTSREEIFKGKSRLGETPMDYVFEAFSEEVSAHLDAQRQAQRRYLRGE